MTSDHPPQTPRGGALKGSAVVEQVPVEMDADVGLEAVREALEDHVHVDPVGVRPGVLEVLFQSLLQGVRNLVKLVELADSLHRRVVPVVFINRFVLLVFGYRAVPEYSL